MKKLKIAVVGCGAVVKKSHLSTFLSDKKIKVKYWVDVNKKNAEELREIYGAGRVLTDWKDAKGVDAAIVATPPLFRKDIVIGLLKKKIHVLVEKPVAISAKDAKEMFMVAKKNKVSLSVGMVRRFLPAHKMTKRLLGQDILGKIKKVNASNGMVFNWPLMSDYILCPENYGGVLFDTGPHVFDTLIWWFGDMTVKNSYSDARGGVDANYLIDAKLGANIETKIELSRTRNLKNKIEIEGEKGKLVVDVAGNNLSLVTNDGEYSLDGEIASQESDIFKAQFKEWVERIEGKESSILAKEDVLSSVHVLDECFNKARLLPEEWIKPIKIEGVDLENKKILVIGGSGFIGCRLVQSLIEDQKASVRVLVRNYSKAVNVARFPVDFIKGDLMDSASLGKATDGVDVVFNCAHGNFGTTEQKNAVNMQGLDNLLAACLENKVQKVVHISTVSVYKQKSTGVISEKSERGNVGHDYGDSKYEGEKIAKKWSDIGLSVSVVEPTVVIGPRAPSWTITPLSQLKTGIVPLVNGGVGKCNFVFIDDVIQALILCAREGNKKFERYLVSGDKAVTWKEFYSYYEKILNITSTESVDKESLLNQKQESTFRLFIKAIKNNPDVLAAFLRLPVINWVYLITKSLLPQETYAVIRDPLFDPDKVTSTDNGNVDEKKLIKLNKTQIDFLSSVATVSIKKAKKRLGYKPKYSLEKSMQLIKKWAEYAQLV